MKMRHIYRGVLCCAVAFPTVVLAQDEEAVDCEVAANQNLPECVDLGAGQALDEVVVTGTYLKRDKFNSPSPIEVITLQDLEEAGTASIGEFIRDLPFTLNSNTINNVIDTGGNGDRQNGSDTSINLRGFGTDGTITLVNGVRASTALDANGLIPDIALERAEILLDGGGALYGADAIAGVVNLISMKEFDGFRAKLYHTTDDGRDYGDSKLSLVTGTNVGGVDIVTSFEAQKRTALSNTERPEYMRESISASTEGNPGTFSGRNIDPGCGAIVPGLNYSDPGKKGFAPTGIPVDNNNVPVAPADAENCLFAFDEFQDYIPAQERYVSNTNFKYDVTEDIELQYNLALQWREATTRTSGFIGSGTLDAMRIYGDHPQMPASFGVADGSYILPANYRPFTKLGTRPSSFNGDGSRNEERETYTYNHTVTANYNFGDTAWSGTTYASSSRRRDLVEEDVIRTSRMVAAMQGLGGPNCGFDSDSLIGLSGSDRQDVIDAAAQTPGEGGCGYFSPFSSALINPAMANDQQLVDWMVPRQQWDTGSSETRTWETRIHGEVLDLPNGPIAVAVGYNFRELTYQSVASDLSAAGDVVNTAGFDFFFSEVVRSQFAELGVPILHNLDFSAAARRENYTDRPFGSVTKPKYSVSYRPIEDLVFRASYSESFTAPRADELDTGSTFEFNLSSLTTDPFSNGNNGVPIASFHGGQLLISGNPELKPEESETINLGFTYRGLDNWRFSMDAQEITYFDRVVSLTRAELFDRQLSQFQETGGDINNQADVLAFFAAEPSPEIPRDPNDGGVLNIFQRPSNADDIIARFVDIKIENDLSTDWGFFNTVLSATAYDQYLYQDEVTLEEFDAVGNRNRDISAARAIPRWKGNLLVRWRQGNHSVVSRVDYVGGVKFDGSEINIGATAPEKINAFTTMDLRYSYTMPDIYNGSMQLTLGSTNIFDREAQKLPIAGGFESRLQDPYGRRIYAEVVYDF